jgi:aryl-alcohol dehydrogenase-like predicted oxidoreductase
MRMEMRRIGALEVSVIGLGTNNFGFLMEEADVPPVVDAALEAGITFFDTSDSYLDSEVRLGKALGSRRDEAVLATKFGSPLSGEGSGGAAPAYVRQAVERSLLRLGTDRIDLYQLHVPDPSTPIAETLGALDELVREGKVREIGCSNFSADQLRQADQATGAGAARLVSVQNHYNLLNRADEAEVLPECRRLGMAYLPYFPLASGLLTGKYTRGESAPPGSRLDRWGDRLDSVFSEENFDVVEALARWAGARGHTLLELAFAWLGAHPEVASVIAGATRPEQVWANAGAVAWTLSPEDLAEIDALAPRPG